MLTFYYSDIVIGDFVDEYANLPYKTFLGFHFFIDHCPDSQIAIFQDDDALINYTKFKALATQKRTLIKDSTICLEKPDTNEVIPFHYHEKYGTDIESYPFGHKYPAYCRFVVDKKLFSKGYRILCFSEVRVLL